MVLWYITGGILYHRNNGADCLIVQLNSNTLFHMPVIRFPSLRWDMAVQELKCGQSPVPCVQQLALFRSYAPLISPTVLGGHYTCK